MIEVPEKEEKDKGLRKYSKRLQLKNSLTWERKRLTSLRTRESTENN